MSGALQIEVEESPKWQDFWRATGRVPFARPGFGSLFTTAIDKCVGLCWEDDFGRALLPLVLRPLPQHVDQPSSWRDAVSPYGYGGPFVTGSPDLTAFFADLVSWMYGEHILTAFLRGGVVGELPDRAVKGYEARHLADNVVVDLTRDPDVRWLHYEHKVRKNVNKALRAGLHASVQPDFGDVDTFVSVYADTMQRRGAASFYRFEREFFENLRRVLAGSFWVAQVVDETGGVISTELVLTGDRFCYSFLGGTRASAYPASPNDLLKHRVIEHGAEVGLAGYVLGWRVSTGRRHLPVQALLRPDRDRAIHGGQARSRPGGV